MQYSKLRSNKSWLWIELKREGQRQKRIKYKANTSYLFNKMVMWTDIKTYKEDVGGKMKHLSVWF